MAVYDKELIIDGKAVRSPEQQVYKNMKDIQALQLKIKEAYKCAGELNTASISVAKSLTNAGEDVKEGWLLDTVGNLFSITGGDEDSLLLDFYCSIRGPQGETGPAGTTAINDLATALDSTWSSKKIDDSLEVIRIDAKQKNTIFYTKTTPTLNGDYYEVTRSDLLNSQNLDPLTYEHAQLIVLDNDNKVKEIYSVVDFVETSPYTLKLTFRGTFGGGKQLYQHNITLYGATIDYSCRLNTIISSDGTEINSLHDLWLLMNARGFCASDNYITNSDISVAYKIFGLTGRVKGSNGYGIIASSTSEDVFYYQSGSGVAMLDTTAMGHNNVKDIVKEL